MFGAALGEHTITSRCPQPARRASPLWTEQGSIHGKANHVWNMQASQRHMSSPGAYEADAANCRSLTVEWYPDFRAGSWKSYTLLGLFFALFACGGWWLLSKRLSDPARTSKPFRVGYVDTPPYNTVAPDGSPQGPYIDIFAEACRGLCESPLSGFTCRRVPKWVSRAGRWDLWTSLGDLPERRKILYISEPWDILGNWMVTLESSKIYSPKDTEERPSGTPASPSTRGWRIQPFHGSADNHWIVQ